MSGVTDYGAAIITSVAAALSVLFAFISRLIGALLLILIGWIVAGIVYRVLVAVLRRLRVDEVAERTGITAFLARGNVQTDAAGLIGDLAKWFIRLIFLEAACNALGMPQVVVVITSIILFIPNLMVALVLLFVGTLIARFVRDLMRASASGAGMAGAPMLANLAFVGVLAFFVAAAVGQIGVATGILNILFTAVVGGLSLALALAFGLGGRDAAGRAIESASGALTGPTTDTTTVRVVTPRGDPRPPADRGR